MLFKAGKKDKVNNQPSSGSNGAQTGADKKESDSSVSDQI